MDFSDGKTALGAHAPISSYKCNYEARNSKRKYWKIWTKLEQKNFDGCSIFWAIFIFINPIQPSGWKIKRMENALSRDRNIVGTLREIVFTLLRKW